MLAVCSAIGLLFSIQVDPPAVLSQRNVVWPQPLSCLPAPSVCPCVVCVCVCFGSPQSLTHATSSSDEGAATVQHSSLDYLLFVVKQARQSVRLNLMLEFLVQFTLASLFWAYFVVEQRKAHSSSSSAEGKDQAPRASSSEKPVTSPSEPRTRERARSRDDGGVEETGEAADKRRNGKDKNGLNRSSDSERDKDSSTSEAKQQDGAKTSDKPRGRRAGSALRTLFLRSLVLHSVVTCSIIFYAFCTWPFSDSWPYYLTFISPLFLVRSRHANPVVVAPPSLRSLAASNSAAPGACRVRCPWPRPCLLASLPRPCWAKCSSFTRAKDRSCRSCFPSSRSSDRTTRPSAPPTPSPKRYPLFSSLYFTLFFYFFFEVRGLGAADHHVSHTFGAQKYDAVSRKITDKQKFLDHSFGEMKSRAEAMSGTAPLLASPQEECNGKEPHRMWGRTPGLISSLSDSDLPLEQRGYVSKLDETNTQLTTFVRDVSIFTKANDGLIDLEGSEACCLIAMTTIAPQLTSSLFVFFILAQPFEVESLLESLITQLSLSPSLLGEKDIDITYQIADDVPRYLIGVSCPTNTAPML